MASAFTIFDALARFRGDTSDVKAKLDQVDKTVKKSADSVEKSFSEGFHRGATKGSQAVEGLGETVGGVFKLMTSPAALAGAAVTAVVAAVIDLTKAGIEFDREWTKTRVFFDNARDAEVFKSKILALGGDLGTVEERSKTFRKALLDTGDPQVALRLEAVAAGLGKITNSDPGQTVTLLGSIMDSTGRKAEDLDTIAARLFFTMKSGGGDVAELGAVFQALVDTAGTVNVSLEEVEAALIALGRVAGAVPLKNMTSLNIALAALEANASKLRERGFDVGAAKTLGEKLQILVAATGGSREGFRELGIQAKAATSIMKLAGEGAQELTKAMRDVNAVTGEDFKKAVATRSQAISSQLDSIKNQIDARKKSTGTSLIGTINDLIFGKELTPTDQPLEQQRAQVTASLDLIEKQIAAKREFEKFSGPSQGAEIASLTTKRDLQVGLLAQIEELISQEQKRNVVTKESIELSGGNAESARAQARDWERLAIVAGLTAKEIGDLGSAERDAIRALGEARDKAALDATLLGATTLEQTVKREQQASQDRIASVLAVADAERALSEERARRAGQVPDDPDRLLGQRRRAAEEGARIEVESINKIVAAQQDAVKARTDFLTRQQADLVNRPGFQNNFALQKQAVDLRTQLEAVAAEGSRIQEDAAAKRVVIEDKLAADLKKIDVDLEKQRNALEEARINKSRQTADSLLSLRRTLDQGTLQQELAVQQQLAAAAKGSADQQIAAIKAVADKAKELRDAARSSATSLLGRATSSLAGQGITEGTLSDVEEEIARLRAQGAENIVTAKTGGTVNFAELGQALGDQGMFEQLDRLGGGFTTVFDIATKGFGDLVGIADTSFRQIEASADGFLQRLTEKVQSGTSQVFEALFVKVYDSLRRQLDLEERAF